MNNYEFLLTFIKNQKFDSKHYFSMIINIYSLSRNSCAKVFCNWSRSKNFRPKKSRGGGGSVLRKKNSNKNTIYYSTN